MPALKLISFDICPYVQRSAIALREKGVDYDIEYVDLALFAGVPTVDAWERALADRPSVCASTVPDVRERFVAAIQGYGAVHQGIGR